MNRTIKIILMVCGVLFLYGCHPDNRKRIAQPVLDPKLKELPEYQKLFDFFLWDFGTRGDFDQVDQIAQDPNLPKPVKR